MDNRADVTGPFALVGALLGITAIVCVPSLASALIAITFTVGLGFAGHCSTRGVEEAWLMPTLGVCVGSSLIAGVSGHSMALSGLIPIVLFLGFGGFLLLVIPLGAWILAAREAGLRRPSSWASRTDSWFFWAAGSLPLVQAANTVGLISLFVGERPLGCSLLFAASTTQLLWVFGYAQQRLRLRALERRAGRLPPCSLELAVAGSFEDLGIGDGARGQIVDDGAYRAAPRLGGCILGDFDQARALLRLRTVEYGRLFATACILPLAIPGAFVLAAIVVRVLL